MRAAVGSEGNAASDAVAAGHDKWMASRSGDDLCAGLGLENVKSKQVGPLPGQSRDNRMSCHFDMGRQAFGRFNPIVARIYLYRQRLLDGSAVIAGLSIDSLE